MTGFTAFANLVLCFLMSACGVWIKDNKNKAKKAKKDLWIELLCF